MVRQVAALGGSGEGKEGIDCQKKRARRTSRARPPPNVTKERLPDDRCGGHHYQPGPQGWSGGDGMTTTGRLAWCTRYWLTLPARSSATELHPRRPVTTRSTSSRPAASIKTAPGRPFPKTSR